MKKNLKKKKMLLFSIFIFSLLPHAILGEFICASLSPGLFTQEKGTTTCLYSSTNDQVKFQLLAICVSMLNFLSRSKFPVLKLRFRLFLVFFLLFSFSLPEHCVNFGYWNVSIPIFFSFVLFLF